MLNNERGGTKRTIEETVLNNLRGGTKRVVIVDGGGGTDPHNKGWFATSAALIAAYPTGADGDYAIVGDTDSIWLWDGDTNAWVNSGQAGQVSSVNGKTGTVVLTPADVNAVPQLAPLPTASASNVGMIAQYKGVTGATYTNGYFYKCVAKGTTPETYEWQKVRVQDGAFVAGTGIDITGDTISVTTAIKDGADLGATSLQPGDNVSELTNDAGYLTEHQTLADLGITATATELNVLDGITASTAELNYVDGVTSPIQTQINTNKTTMDNHIANTSNPHQVTKAQVGLGNVDNTSDLNKPVSTATQTALDGKQPKSNAAFSVGNATGGWTALSSAQQSALNSGATTTNIAQITTNQTAIATEKTARENADDALQDQIDALVAKSDVVDVVGTYAELQAYPTSTLHTNDVVKVISDSTHNAAPSYYRWVITGTTGAWTYIGSLADSYTKSETDTLLNAKQDALTTAQLAAVNSGVTASTVSQVATNTTAIAGKQDTLTAGTNITITGATISATDTTYTGSDGITLTGTNFTNSGVRSIAQGATNGTISVNTNGTSAEVAVKGLGTAAYTASTAYATAAQGALADTAVQPADLATVATSGSYNDLSNKPTIGDGEITFTQEGIVRGKMTVNQTGDKTIDFDAVEGNVGRYLFYHHFSDHILNDVRWLRADTFSWQDGEVYFAAYNHLKDEITGKTLQSETVAGVTIQFYLADDGHKICPATEQDNVLSLYNATGVAWYYIIDTANKKFKLPRTKFAFTGIRSGVGNYVEAGVPNITGNWYPGLYSNVGGTSSVALGNYFNQTYDSCTASGAFKSLGQTRINKSDDASILHFDASLSNSIYGNSNTVQPPATEMYLYFYVGNFTQTAIENTAGLNAELFNGKADLNLLNTTDNVDFVVERQDPTSENGYTWYRKYKSGWVEQGGYIDGNYSHTFSGTYMSSYAATTITLPVEMANTNVNIYCNSTVGQVIASGILNGTTALEIMLASANHTASGVDVSWQVSGKAA